MLVAGYNAARTKHTLLEGGWVFSAEGKVKATSTPEFYGPLGSIVSGSA
jgi:hypothetical protein